MLGPAEDGAGASKGEAVLGEGPSGMPSSTLPTVNVKGGATGGTAAAVDATACVTLLEGTNLW
jgi:hypothetical protein